MRETYAQINNGSHRNCQIHTLGQHEAWRALSLQIHHLITLFRVKSPIHATPSAFVDVHCINETNRHQLWNPKPPCWPGTSYSMRDSQHMRLIILKTLFRDFLSINGVQVITSKINIISGATVMNAEGMTNRDMRWTRGRKRIPRWYMTWRLSFLKPNLYAANVNDANAKAVPQIAVVIITFTITPTTSIIFVDVVTILMILIIADLSTMQPSN